MYGGFARRDTSPCDSEVAEQMLADQALFRLQIHLCISPFAKILDADGMNFYLYWLLSCAQKLPAPRIAQVSSGHAARQHMAYMSR